MNEIDLAFHGGIVLMIGLLVGLPYTWVLLKSSSDDEIRAWRVSHSALCVDAIAMIAMAAALPILSMPSHIVSVVVISFVIGGYGFVFSMLLGPISKQRGLSFAGSVINRCVFAGNCVGSVGSLVSTAYFIYGGYLAL